MSLIQIVDLDGCLSDDRWRRRYLPVLPRCEEHLVPGCTRCPPFPGKLQELFHSYHRWCEGDDPVNFDQLHPDAGIVILTARPVAFAQRTETWMNFVAPAGFRSRVKHIIYRNNDDQRHSVDVKRDMVRWLMEPNLMYDIRPEQVVDAIDDRDDIVEMYRTEFNLPARVVRIGEEGL